jgi:hypothetical protein
MAHDDSGQRDLEVELMEALTEVARLQAENERLRTIAQVAVTLLTPASMGELRATMAALDGGADAR